MQKKYSSAELLKMNQNRFKGVKVLVTDDNATNLELMNEYMHLFGITMDSAMTGAEALKKVQDKSYDIVFMDIMLPDMSGYKAAQIIKENKAVPVVAMTARQLNYEMKKHEVSSMDGFLEKPVNIMMLIEMIEKTVTSKAAKP